MSKESPHGGAGADEPRDVLPFVQAGVDPHADLESVLAAWHTATVRLERTHEALRSEVRRLTDELEIKNRELARKNRLADLGRVSTVVAHEVRNHLVPLTLYLNLLRRRLADDPGSLDTLDRVAAGITELDATVNDLLHFTSDREPDFEPLCLRALVDDVVAALAPQLSAQGIEVDVDVPPYHEAHADRDMLRRAILNLMLNALDAMPEGGDLVVTSVETPRGMELEIADSGPGLSDEVRRHAFEPFYSTKSSGTGLGLAIVDHIVARHGGNISALNCHEGGAAFTLTIPRRVVRLQGAKAA
jgi:signal transduction histidine kinase